MKKTLWIILFFITGCSGFHQDSLSSLSGAGDNTSTSVNLDYQLAIQNGPYSGQIVIDNIRDSKVRVLIPLGTNPSVSPANFSSTQWSLSGSISQDGNGYKILQVDVPYSFVSQGVSGADIVTQLPNGDALDFITSGQAQHFSIPVDSNTNVYLHFYFSPPTLLGVFIQTPFDLSSSNKYSVTPVGSFMEAGFFGTYPHHSPLNGGELVFISLPQ